MTRCRLCEVQPNQCEFKPIQCIDQEWVVTRTCVCVCAELCNCVHGSIIGDQA